MPSTSKTTKFKIISIDMTAYKALMKKRKSLRESPCAVLRRVLDLPPPRERGRPPKKKKGKSEEPPEGG